jgi:hypothetical protein
MRLRALLLCLGVLTSGFAQSYPPAEDQPGTTAIFKDSPLYVDWATGVTVERGLVNKSDPEAMANGSHYATAGIPDAALGYPDGDVVSLGDGGNAILTFAVPIIDGTGFDFAVFENGGSSFLELAFVEVSSDGVNFFRFPNHSETQNETQIGSFGTPQAAYLHNLAGKYGAQYGTPFDLSEIPNNDLLDKNNITHVKVVDVVGSIDPAYASFDSLGNAVNESFPTPFPSCGFDLQAVGILNRLVLDVPSIQESAVVLYPNPANDMISIKGNRPCDITVYDMSGRLVLTREGVSNKQINVSHLSAGAYNVFAVSGGVIRRFPLIIAR